MESPNRSSWEHVCAYLLLVPSLPRPPQRTSSAARERKPIKSRRNYMKPTQSAGKRVRTKPGVKQLLFDTRVKAALHDLFFKQETVARISSKN